MESRWNPDTVSDIERLAKSDAYGRLRVLLGLVQWTTENDIRDGTLQPFIDLLRRETARQGRGKAA